MELSREFRERFIKTLQGREYILYGGVLELARQRGLKRITTNVIQIPAKENGYYAVMEAEVETDDGVFKEVGDASPDNVNRAIVPHLLRMAATRAKARAMRDAVGIDMVAFEELGEAAPEEVALPRPEEMVIGFGKYASRTLGQVLHQDRGYVEWLASNARDEAVRKAAAQLLGGGGAGEGAVQAPPITGHPGAVVQDEVRH